MEPESRDSGPPPRRSGAHPWRWPVVAIVVAVLLAIAYFVTLERFAAATRRLAAAPGSAIEGLERLSRGLLTGDVTHRFLSAIPEIAGPRAGNLELAVAEVVETFERTDERRALWDLVSLGSTTVGVRVPVVYRYHVPMAGEWRAVVEGDRLTVVAPALAASLPPAIRTDRMERRIESGWLGFDGAARLSELERQLTPMLVARARDPRHLELVRESARRALAQFARGWLVREGEASASIRELEVRFADEPEGAAEPAVLFSARSDRREPSRQ